MRPELDLYPAVEPLKSKDEANWDSMVRLAHADPAARAYVTLAERGDMTREQALVALAFYSYEQRRMDFRAKVDRFNTEVPDFIMIGDKRYDRSL